MKAGFHSYFPDEGSEALEAGMEFEPGFVLLRAPSRNRLNVPEPVATVPPTPSPTQARPASPGPNCPVPTPRPGRVLELLRMGSGSETSRKKIEGFRAR